MTSSSLTEEEAVQDALEAEAWKDVDRAMARLEMDKIPDGTPQLEWLRHLSREMNKCADRLARISARLTEAFAGRTPS